MSGSNSGRIAVLKDSLATYQTLKEIHENRRKLDERAFYPVHDRRKESAEYAKVHERLVVTEDRPCLICCVRNSTLSDPSENRYGANQMETHHHVIEWALANAISVEKFNSHLRPHLAQRHPERPDYKQDFTQAQMLAWIDHDEDNLWVLCNVHHRAKFFGIHEITDPVWGPMDLLEDDFEDYAMQQIEGD